MPGLRYGAGTENSFDEVKQKINAQVCCVSATAQRFRR